MAGDEGDRDVVDPSRSGEIVAPPDDAEVERAIASVPGVTAATLRRDPDSGRTRLRLRLRAGEDAEQAAWSIAATLRERFGIALDPDSIRPISASESADHEVAEADEEAGFMPAERAPAPDADDAARASGPDGPVSPPSPPAVARTPPPAPEVWAVPEPGHGAGGIHDPRPGSAPAQAPPSAPGDLHASPPGRAPATAPGEAHGTSPVLGRVPESSGTTSGSHLGDRATIHRLDIERGAREVQATVALRRGEQAAQGVARAVPTTRSVLRAIAEATASALQQFMTAPLLIGIDRIEVEPAADPAHVLVAVTILADRGEEQLLGVSLVRGDAERAVVRATLDALNRRVSPFFGGEPEREPETAAAS
jgi:hypothetical protein